MGGSLLWLYIKKAKYIVQRRRRRRRNTVQN
jgi:hypothetical protein